MVDANRSLEEQSFMSGFRQEKIPVVDGASDPSAYNAGIEARKIIDYLDDKIEDSMRTISHYSPRGAEGLWETTAVRTVRTKLNHVIEYHDKLNTLLEQNPQFQPLIADHQGRVEGYKTQAQEELIKIDPYAAAFKSGNIASYY